MDMWKEHTSYCNGQLEKGKDGTQHFQVYIALPVQKRMAALKKIDKRAHFSKVTKDNGASAYCMKEDTRLQGPIEWGTRPLCPASKTDWAEVKKLAIANKLDDIEPGVFIRYYNSLTRIAKDNVIIPKRTFAKECIWIHGPPRTGKSRHARDAPHYCKLANKWWDGYKPDDTHVVIDDLGKDKAHCLRDHIK